MINSPAENLRKNKLVDQSGSEAGQLPDNAPTSDDLEGKKEAIETLLKEQQANNQTSPQPIKPEAEKENQLSEKPEPVQPSRAANNGVVTEGLREILGDDVKGYQKILDDTRILGSNADSGALASDILEHVLKASESDRNPEK